MNNLNIKILPTLLFLLPILYCSLESHAQAQWNMELFGQADRGDDRYSGSWAYIDEATGKEYALLGTTSGMAIYDINQPELEELFFFPGPYSRWREITVIGSHAYVVTEGSGFGEGMQVIDLTALPENATLVTTFDSRFRTGHIISRDIYSDQSYVYISGTCGNCGVEIVDVAEPTQPALVGQYRPGYYIHDCHVRGNFLYAAAFFNSTIDIVDISDKTNPILIAQIEVPGGNVHSAWTTEDEKYLIISAESDGLPARIWNIEDLENMFEVTTYSGNLESLTHNPYTRGDFVFFSHNTEGITVVDVKDPRLPLEVGFYDTFDGRSGGFNGLWSACPYFPSGKIIGGNREDGLYVWTFNETPANRIYLTIKDAITQAPLEGVVVTNATNEFQSDATGEIAWATLETNMELSLTLEGYQTKDTTMQLIEGEQFTTDIYLLPRTVPTKELLSSQMPKVYPNPFTQHLTFAFDRPSQTTKIEILNSLSQRVMEQPIRGQNRIVLSTASLPAGMYQYVLKNELGEILINGKVLKY